MKIKQLKIKKNKKKVDLCASLLGNLLAGKGIYAGGQVFWAGERTKAVSKGSGITSVIFNDVSSFD